MKILVAFIVGLLFALGLGISGMTQVQVVKGFLDITGNWNPTLIGVMVGAILIHSILYRLIRKRSSPVLDKNFHIPISKSIDGRLLLGSAIFGLGWGWAGICPGPGLVALTNGDSKFIVFIVSMILGMAIFKLIERKSNK